MRNRPTTTSAFTLLELVLVMGILTLVVAMAAPSLIGFAAGRRTGFTASRIVSMAGFARTQAVTEGRTWRMNFDPTTREIWLTVQVGNQFQPPSSDLGAKAQAAEGIQLRTDLLPQPDGQYVEFHSDGRTDPAHIWITDAQGRSIEVACLAATELFHVLKPGEMTQ